jgi:hypothetical protein
MNAGAWHVRVKQAVARGFSGCVAKRQAGCFLVQSLRWLWVPSRSGQRVALPELARDDLGMRYAASAKTMGAADQLFITGPPDFFQASIPPSIWAALARPASCAALTAIAERSP